VLILPNAPPNAWTIGEHVILTDGLLSLAEEELLAVIGHEIGHIARGDSEKNLAFSLIVIGAMLALAEGEIKASMMEDFLGAMGGYLGAWGGMAVGEALFDRINGVIDEGLDGLLGGLVGGIIGGLIGAITGGIFGRRRKEMELLRHKMKLLLRLKKAENVFFEGEYCSDALGAFVSSPKALASALEHVSLQRDWEKKKAFILCFEHAFFVPLESEVTSGAFISAWLGLPPFKTHPPTEDRIVALRNL